MNRKRYFDPAHYEAEEQAVFHNAWSFAGHERQFRQPGSAWPLQNASGHFLLTRAATGELNAFHNCCRHVGMALLQKPCTPKSGALTCPYHGWRYGLDGALQHAPMPEVFKSFKPEKLSLQPATLLNLNGLLFLHPAPDQPPDEGFTTLGEKLSAAGASAMGPVFHQHRTVACNWKAPLEQGLECYHALTTHANTLARYLDFTTTRHEKMGEHQLNLYHVAAPPWARWFGLTAGATPVFHRFLVFPFTMVSLPLPGRHVAVTSVTPLGPGSCRVDFLFMHRPSHGLPWRVAGAWLSALVSRWILWEDLRMLSARQQGLVSGEAPLQGFGAHETGARVFNETVEKRLAQTSGES